MYCTPLIVVKDVPASSRWYQEVLGVSGGHGGDEFEMIMEGGTLLLMLHHRDFGEHPAITDPSGGPGAGVLIYFGVDDVKPVFDRARAMGAEIIDEPRENPKARAVEFSLKDPDGYAVTVSQWTG